jgi:hypothetical protein
VTVELSLSHTESDRGLLGKRGWARALNEGGSAKAGGLIAVIETHLYPQGRANNRR